MFRQAAVHYIRSHPGFRTAGGWLERFRLLRISFQFVRGKGEVPLLLPEFPRTKFNELERPLGPLPDDVARPLNRYFETHSMSKQYAVVGTGRSLVDSFRLLAFLHPMAMWLLRLAVGDRKPAQDDMVNIVAALERGHGLAALSRGTTAMADTEQLERLIAWYAR
jgi:hypothetical protein